MALRRQRETPGPPQPAGCSSPRAGEGRQDVEIRAQRDDDAATAEAEERRRKLVPVIEYPGAGPADHGVDEGEPENRDQCHPQQAA